MQKMSTGTSGARSLSIFSVSDVSLNELNRSPSIRRAVLSSTGCPKWIFPLLRNRMMRMGRNVIAHWTFVERARACHPESVAAPHPHTMKVGRASYSLSRYSVLRERVRVRVLLRLRLAPDSNRTLTQPLPEYRERRGIGARP